MCTFSYVRDFGMKYFKIHNGYILNHPPIDLILIIQFKEKLFSPPGEPRH
jgi:hypothetical protein